MRKPLQRHFFYRRKTNIGGHLRQHCRMLASIPMAVHMKLGVQFLPCHNYSWLEPLGHVLNLPWLFLGQWDKRKTLISQEHTYLSVHAEPSLQGVVLSFHLFLLLVFFRSSIKHLNILFDFKLLQDLDVVNTRN